MAAVSRSGRIPARTFVLAFWAGAVTGAAVVEGVQSNRRRDADKGPRQAPRAPGASDPVGVSGQGWRAALTASAKDFGHDRIAATAAGVTFYALLAIFPGISAFVSLYSLVADVGAVRRQVLGLEGLLPGGAVTVLAGELARLAGANHGALGLALIGSIAVSIWSANAGLKALIDGLNVAYETREERNFIVLTLVSLTFTLGALLLAAASVALMVAAPRALGAFGMAGAEAVAVWLRWPLIVIIATLALSVLYRFGPSRSESDWRWITPGGVSAAIVWLVMSALFSWYVANFGHYNKTYGSLGAIVGCLTWIWLSVMVVLFGAELNNEVERQAGRASRGER